MRARRKPSRSARLLCAALSLYSTWPCAQPPTPEGALALKPSVEISHWLPLDFELERGEPLRLLLTLHLSAPDGLPVHVYEPLMLAIALAIGSAASRLETARRKTSPIDFTGAQPVFYGVRVNTQDLGVARLVRLADGRLLARRVDLEEWRLHIPDVPPALFRGEEHFPLDAFEGLTARYDEARQELALDIAPRYFSPTVLEGPSSRVAKPVVPPPGGFLNYDVLFEGNTDAKGLGGLFEAGVFNRLGVLTSGFLMQDLWRETRGVRLDTTWRRDLPDEMKSLVIGDAIGSSGVWGRPVRYGGLRYGTNFATNPGFITFPLPGLRGEAALPTTTELYVDGVLRQSSNVPPGPFRIENLPVITGKGEVRMVVRDMLGREQVIEVPYYASSQLLRKDLTEDSYEVGVARNNFGLRSNDYGRFVSVVQRRKGFTDYITGEARAELLSDQQTGGIAGSVSFPRVGIATGGAAVSHSEKGNGRLFHAEFERQVVRGVTFGVRSQWSSADFAQLGLQPGQRAPVRVMGGNVGFSPAGYGSLGFAYLRQDSRDQLNTEIVSASYTLSVGKSSALLFFAFKPLNGEGTQAVGVTLSIGLGERTAASVGYTAQPNANEAQVQIQQNLPTGSGTGYRVFAGTGGAGSRLDAAFAVQTDFGRYTVEAGRSEDQVGYRAGASGSLAVLGGRAYLSRDLTESFAVAHVPGFADIGIAVNNQPVARTDVKGYAVLPRLLAYQANTVRVETADLPLDTQIDAAQLDAVPYYRSGMLLSFPIQRANGALLTLVLDDGRPMPVGSIVSIVGRAGEFPVAERGEAYVTGLTRENTLRATWRAQSCELKVVLGEDAGPVPRIGPITCAGVQR